MRSSRSRNRRKSDRCADRRTNRKCGWRADWRSDGKVGWESCGIGRLRLREEHIRAAADVERKRHRFRGFIVVVILPVRLASAGMWRGGSAGVRGRCVVSSTVACASAIAMMKRFRYRHASHVPDELRNVVDLLRRELLAD